MGLLIEGSIMRQLIGWSHWWHTHFKLLSFHNGQRTCSAQIELAGPKHTKKEREREGDRWICI